MFHLKTISTFSAAHSVTLPNGDREPVHGHNWRLEVSLASPALSKFGMVEDFEKIKMIVRETVLERLDHSCLNDLIDPPTCEKTAEWIFGELKKKIDLESVTLWESQNCGVTYSPEE